MVDLQRIKARIKPEEGYSSMPYKCTAGHMTIGWGWNMDANPLPKDVQSYLDGNGLIAPSHAERLLTISIGRAIEGCKHLWPNFESFPLNAQEALIDVVFNMGAGKIEQKFPRFTAEIMAQNWQRGADELKYADGKERLSKWYQDVKPRRADAIIDLLRGA